MRILLVATVACLLLAGCANAPAAHGLELRDDAEAAAKGLDSSSELVALFGAEWTNESIGDEFETESPEAAAMNQGVDDSLGDGKANVWGFLFKTSGDPILVALDGNGKVLHAERIPPDSNTADSYDGYVPLGDVNLNSIEAAAIVRENSEKFVDIIAREDAVVVMALGSDENSPDPFWVFTALTEEGEQFSLSLVNAMDGSYSDFSEFSDFMEGWGS